ncbi:hypothetical protein D1007_32990 [Hordeum vulgare]|nr:hypothetical protein D1007_32990 [Hordeum vulgare]
MVFEDESSDDRSSLPNIHSSNSSTDGIYQVRASVEDPDYHGLELGTMVFCEKHDKASMRHVAFEGTYIGRRFLACAEPEGDNCGFVEWVDQEWPITIENALLKLWTMFKDTKNARVTAMEKLELQNGELTKSEEKLTQEKLELKFKIADLLKGKEVQSEERGHLELQIAELMKGVEELKLKLKCILVILHK